ncbi:MAG: CapA family protein [bacterium]|nr:CapA family protein [bacterium]
MKRFFFFAIILTSSLLLLAGSFLLWSEQAQAPNDEGQENKKELVLLFAGDIMLDRGVEFYVKENGGDWKFPFLKIAGFLKGADLVFGNLESVISDKGEKQGSIYSFRADPQSMEGLVSAGFDVVSVANNHSMDYGAEAFLDSIQRLKDANITPVGFNHEPVIVEVQGTKIGFLAYTEQGSPLWDNPQAPASVTWMDGSRLSQLMEEVEAAKLAADIVVVSFHFGDEYQTKPNATQELLSKTAISAGANLVIGHHPHIVQSVEQYQTGWIAYSLGNFVFDQGFSKETMEGLLLEVIVQEKKITKVSPRPIHLNYLFQPSLAE